eukprot:16928_1
MEELYESLEYCNDGISTQTSIEQAKCENKCSAYFFLLHPSELTEEERWELEDIGWLSPGQGKICLLRDKHETFLRAALSSFPLPASYVTLDASRSWMLYWIRHSLALLGAKRDPEVDSRIIRTLASCQSPEGGFGGGLMQIPHAATTYAAILALLDIGTLDAYTAIDRPNLLKFFRSMKHSSGGFRMHHDGEVDSRATYCVIAVASLLDILVPDLTEGVAEYCLSTQTYEGGFGGEPGNEAHGGYAFCAFATLCILGREGDADIQNLEYWLCMRQTRLEGGFQGRTNKLVDGCYTFWVGGTIVLLEHALQGSVWLETRRNGRNLAIRPVSGGGGTPDDRQVGKAEVMERDGSLSVEPNSGYLSCNASNAQRYVLLCSQNQDGGLRDKPGMSSDYYHTCYSLSGLSVLQHSTRTGEKPPNVFGCVNNMLEVTNACYNIIQSKVDPAMAFFSAQGSLT